MEYCFYQFNHAVFMKSLFWAAHGLGKLKVEICYIYLTMMKLGTVILDLKKTPKIY